MAALGAQVEIEFAWAFLFVKDVPRLCFCVVPLLVKCATFVHWCVPRELAASNSKFTQPWPSTNVAKSRAHFSRTGWRPRSKCLMSPRASQKRSQLYVISVKGATVHFEVLDAVPIELLPPRRAHAEDEERADETHAE